jgi:Na+/H+ antiporter NhaD/arsenite permease-like protein
LEFWGGQPGWDAFTHGLAEYADFIILLSALYIISGGIHLQGDIRATPWVNVSFLALGAILANLVGTTGASMLLIRPVLRANQQRQFTSHLPIFFIFIVSNLGGLLTPLGDPPLFLGFLRGVDFFWTLQLWPQWLIANLLILTIFFIWDSIAYFRETKTVVQLDIQQLTPLRFLGRRNFLLMAGILLVVLFQSSQVALGTQRFLSQWFDCPSLLLVRPWGGLAMLGLALFSLGNTPRKVRVANGFTWHAILEVAFLFIGIFITMIPALDFLANHAPQFGLSKAWQFFWLTGSLSSILDNAPTYLTFATIAAGNRPLADLMSDPNGLLQAISCGAVFMGAMTYIGNGPNFMVKTIAEERGYKMPSFFGYLLYSGLILLPTFFLVNDLFFGNQ